MDVKRDTFDIRELVIKSLLTLSSGNQIFSPNYRCTLQSGD